MVFQQPQHAYAAEGRPTEALRKGAYLLNQTLAWPKALTVARTLALTIALAPAPNPNQEP